MKERHVILEINSGEIKAELGEKYKYTPQGELEYLDDHQKLNENRPFVKVFEDFGDIAARVSGASLYTMCKLTPYISFGSNLIARKRSSVPLVSRDIEIITGYTYRTVKKCLAELVDKKVFARVRVGRSYSYYANPYIFCKGEEFNKTLKTMFKGYQFIP